MSSTDLARSESEIQTPPAPRRRLLSEMNRGTMILCQILLGATIMGMWQLASVTIVDNFFISNPIDVSIRLWEWTFSGFIWIHLWVTLYETLAGFALGSLIGVSLGIWLGVAHFMSRLLNPFLFGFYAMPKIALAPLFVLWFGLGLESKIALSTVIVFFLVFFNTYTGVREVDPELIDAVRLMKRKYIGCVLVVKEDRLIGIFTERDLMTRVVPENIDVNKTPVSEYMTPDPKAVERTEPLADVFEMLSMNRFRHVPITDKGKAVGIVSLSDFAAVLKEVFEEDKYLNYFLDVHNKKSIDRL